MHASSRSVGASPYSRPPSTPTAHLPMPHQTQPKAIQAQAHGLPAEPSGNQQASLHTVPAQAPSLRLQLSALQQQFMALHAERTDLSYKVAIANANLASAQKQVRWSLSCFSCNPERLTPYGQLSMFHAQCTVLAKEAGARRQKYIDETFPPANFFDPARMQCRVASIPERKLPEFRASLHIKHLAAAANNKTRTNRAPSIVFASRPPSSLPLCVGQIAQHGYWFAPVDIPLPEETFELLVECSRERWMYLGRYQHVPLSETYSMGLSEWAVLDEEVRSPFLFLSSLLNAPL